MMRQTMSLPLSNPEGSLVEGEPVVFYFKGLVFNSVNVPPEETKVNILL